KCSKTVRSDRTLPKRSGYARVGAVRKGTEPSRAASACVAFPENAWGKRGVSFHTRRRIASGRRITAESPSCQAPHTTHPYRQRHGTQPKHRLPTASRRRMPPEHHAALPARGVAHRARASRGPQLGRPVPGARLRPRGSPKRAMLEGNRVSRISVRGFAVASATAVTAVGSVVGVASGSTAQNNDVEATAAGTTLLADIPAGQQAQVQTAS